MYPVSGKRIGSPFEEGIRRVDSAVAASRQRDTNKVSDSFQRQRYEILSRDPVMLGEFVAEALGTDDPELIRVGGEDYLKEMGARYGRSGR